MRLSEAALHGGGGQWLSAALSEKCQITFQFVLNVNLIDKLFPESDLISVAAAMLRFEAFATPIPRVGYSAAIPAGSSNCLQAHYKPGFSDVVVPPAAHDSGLPRHQSRSSGHLEDDAVDSH